MSDSNFHRNHAHHTSLSEKLSEELKNSGKDVLQQVSVMEEKMTQKMLIKVVNDAVRYISWIIPDLQEIVIKVNTEKECNADLKNVVKKLSQYCDEIVQEYDSDPGTLKQKFLVFLKNVIADAENLLDIIRKDSLHDFKHELIENLKELMMAMQSIQYRIQIENYSPQDIIDLIENTKNECTKDIAVIENCNADVLRIVGDNTKFIVQHGMRIAYQFNKAASNYHDVEIQHALLDAAKLLNSGTTRYLFVHDNLPDTKEALKTLTPIPANCWIAYEELYKFMNSAENNKESENLSDVVKYGTSYGIVLCAHTGRGAKIYDLCHNFAK